jgi:hypothetical protein
VTVFRRPYDSSLFLAAECLEPVEIHGVSGFPLQLGADYDASRIALIGGGQVVVLDFCTGQVLFRSVLFTGFTDWDIGLEGSLLTLRERSSATPTLEVIDWETKRVFLSKHQLRQLPHGLARAHCIQFQKHLVRVMTLPHLQLVSEFEMTPFALPPDLSLQCELAAAGPDGLIAVQTICVWFGSPAPGAPKHISVRDSRTGAAVAETLLPLDTGNIERAQFMSRTSLLIFFGRREKAFDPLRAIAAMFAHDDEMFLLWDWSDRTPAGRLVPVAVDNGPDKEHDLFADMFRGARLFVTHPAAAD